jgi:hypothetical protein
MCIPHELHSKLKFNMDLQQQGQTMNTIWLDQIIMYKMDTSILPHHHKLFILYAMLCHSYCLFVLPTLHFQRD